MIDRAEATTSRLYAILTALMLSLAILKQR